MSTKITPLRGGGAYVSTNFDGSLVEFLVKLSGNSNDPMLIFKVELGLKSNQTRRRAASFLSRFLRSDFVNNSFNKFYSHVEPERLVGVKIPI